MLRELSLTGCPQHPRARVYYYSHPPVEGIRYKEIKQLAPNQRVSGQKSQYLNPESLISEATFSI